MPATSLLTLQDIITPTEADEIEAEVLSLCATGGLTTSAWQPGSVVRTMIAILSEVISRKSLVEVEIAKGGLGDLASPTWAKLWAERIYNVIFVPAASATGYLVLTNATATPHTLQPGDLIVAHAVTGKTYRNQDVIEVPASGSTDPAFAIMADEVGTASNAEPGAITRVVAPGSLIGVTATNPGAVLGADEETTEKLVERTRLKLGSFSPLGPKKAYDFVARTPLDQFPAVDGTLLAPTSTPITRTRTTLNLATGDVETYLATAGGAPTGPDVDLVQAGFERWAEPWGTTSVALAASDLNVPVSYEVWVRTSLSEAQVASLASAALAAYFASVDVGGVVIPPDTGAIYVEAIENVIHMSIPGAKRVRVTAPAADVAVSPFQVPVLGAVSATVNVLR